MEEGDFSLQSVNREIQLMSNNAETKNWKSPTGEIFSLKIPHTVYPPREDTDLMAEALVRLGPGKGRKCLEIGLGSGVLSLLCHRQGWKVTACDINPLAIASASELFSRNGASDIDVNEGGPGPAQDGKITQWTNNDNFDLIFWNLPYIDKTNLVHGTLGPLEDAALIDTTKTSLLNLTLKRINNSNLLTKTGIALFVIGEKHYSEDFEGLAVSFGFACRVIKNRVFQSGEKISVLACWRPYPNSIKEHLQKTTSTSTELLRSKYKIGSSISADIQTCGRGRKGRKWINADEAFACSWRIGDQTQLSPIILQILCGLIVKKTLHGINANHSKTDLILKWPNDVLAIDDNHAGKISGVLLESRSTDTITDVVLGVGINIVNDDHKSIEFNMSTVDQLTGEKIARASLHNSIECRLAGLFETKQGLPETNWKQAIKQCKREISLAFSAASKLIYRNQAVRFDHINDDGLVTLIDENSQRHLCDDGESITWLFD